MLWPTAPNEPQLTAGTNHQLNLTSSWGPRHHIAESGAYYLHFLICSIVVRSKWNNTHTKSLLKRQSLFCGYFYYCIRRIYEIKKIRSLLSKSPFSMAEKRPRNRKGQQTQNEAKRTRREVRIKCLGYSCPLDSESSSRNLPGKAKPSPYPSFIH